MATITQGLCNLRFSKPVTLQLVFKTLAMKRHNLDSNLQNKSEIVSRRRKHARCFNMAVKFARQQVLRLLKHM